MWKGVTNRFRQFNKNLLLTDEQIEDGKTKHHGVRSCLNYHYYGIDSNEANSRLVGSWGKLTRVRPPRDIDVLFVLPDTVYERFGNYVGNKQSAILQEVKNVLQKSYPSTDMSGDGQVIVVRFSTISVEIVPAFKLKNGQYRICDTNNGGSYKTIDPVAEIETISTVHSENNNNLRPLIRMLKAWQEHCSVPLKSFYIELLTTDFLKQSEWRNNGFFYYDWFIRDFFKYLQSKDNSYIFVPGTLEVIYLGTDWKSRCDNAYGRALKACEYEYDDFVNLAGEEWQKIFGSLIPQDPT